MRLWKSGFHWMPILEPCTAAEVVVVVHSTLPVVLQLPILSIMSFVIAAIVVAALKQGKKDSALVV